MLIAIDGNVYCGKTTLAAHFANKEWFLLWEYRPVASDGKLSENKILAIQDSYLNQELDRIRLLQKGNKTKCIMDRSYLSVLAHMWVNYKKNQNLFKKFVDLLEKKLMNDEILLPDIYLHISWPHIIIRKRYLARESSSLAKSTPKAFISDAYLSGIDNFHLCMHQKLQNTNCLIFNSTTINDIIHFVDQFIEIEYTQMNYLEKKKIVRNALASFN